MPVCTSASLLVNVVALDDVTSQEDFHLAVAENAFTGIVEAAVRRIAEEYFDGERHDGFDHTDWNGSRLQYTARQKARVYTLVIFRFDYQERPPLVCCSAPDLVYGSRRLIAQYAVMQDGRRARIEALPECDTAKRRPLRTPAKAPPSTPTLHRWLEPLHRSWQVARKATAGLAQAIGQWWRRCRFDGATVASPAVRLLATIAALVQHVGRLPLMSAGRIVYLRIIALAGCSPGKCQGSARSPSNGAFGSFDPGGMLAALGRLATAIRLPRNTSHRPAGIPIVQDSREIRALVPRDCESLPDHLAAIHGMRNTDRPAAPGTMGEPADVPDHGETALEFSGPRFDTGQRRDSRGSVVDHAPGAPRR